MERDLSILREANCSKRFMIVLAVSNVCISLLVTILSWDHVYHNFWGHNLSDKNIQCCRCSPIYNSYIKSLEALLSWFMPTLSKQSKINLSRSAGLKHTKYFVMFYSTTTNLAESHNINCVRLRCRWQYIVMVACDHEVEKWSTHLFIMSTVHLRIEIK